MPTSDLAASHDETPSSTLQISIFALLRQDLLQTVPVVQCSKATLVHLSHTLEDLVLSQRLPALMFTGFQESSYWRQETERYRALAEVAQQVCIFAGGQLPPESNARQLHVTLRGDDPLRQEWFVTILAPEFSVVLCGQDQAVPVEEESLRRFDTIWSFDPAVVNRVLDRMEEVIGAYRPERLEVLRDARRRFPPTAPNPNLITMFTAEMLRFEEHIQQALYLTSRSLNGQLRWREQLTEMLVHDLRTPLQSVLMALDLLRSAPNLDRETLQATVNLALRGTTNITSMVSLILDTNRLEAQQFQVQWQQLALAEIVEAAIEPLRPQIEHARLQLAIKLDQAPPTCWGDRELLTRVVQNLVSNACKFTATEGSITIESRPSATPHAIDLLVIDTGMGIVPSALPHIFERHFQGIKSDRRGIGIGLYFCRLAMEAQGGTIRATSQPGSGSTFAITVLGQLPPFVYRERGAV